jgi:hydrogenase maturation factor
MRFPKIIATSGRVDRNYFQFRPIFTAISCFVKKLFSTYLGLDQLYVTNEGKLIAVVASEIADTVVAGLRKYPNGRDACVIGEVKAEPRGMVVLGTIFSGTRIVDMLVREPAPRIC